MAKKVNKQLNSVVYKPGKAKKALTFFVDNSGKNLEDTSVYLKQTEQKALKQKSNKSKVINLVCFIISILVLVITLIVQQHTYGVHDITTLEIRQRYLWFTLFAFLGIMIFDSIRTSVLLHRSTGELRPFLSFKSTVICRYYDCITPFSFGGQPFQIYYLNSRGVKGGVASSVPLSKYIYSQVTFCIVSTILLAMGIVNGLFSNTNTKTVISFSIVTLVICILFLCGIFFISLSKKVTPKVVWWLISIAYKLKIVKSRELAYTNSMRSILEYQRSIKYYMKSFWTTLISFVLSIGIIALKGLIPYLIYLMFVPNPTVSYFTILILYNACELITMFSPLPGGSGVAELSFTTLFFAMFPETYIFWAMIFFRVFTYYIYIAQGMLVHIYDIVIGNKLNDKYLSRKNSR